jgi:RimJ/RimL family protein N-acetyltransferase
VLRFAFDVAGLEEVVSFTVPANLPSQAVMQAVGMRYDGVFEHPRGVGQWWGPHVLYRVSRQDLGARTDPSGRTRA